MLGEFNRYAVTHNGQQDPGAVIEDKDLWVLHLRIGIVRQAAEDLRVALHTHDEGATRALCNWLLSDWGQMLSFGQGEAIIRHLKREVEAQEENGQ